MGFAVQLAVLHVLMVMWHVSYVAAVFLSVEAAILHNFVWHERWTWKERLIDSSHWTRGGRLLRFNVTTGTVSLVGNVIVTTALVELIGLPVLVANALAIAGLTAANFLVADRWTFVPVVRSVAAAPARWDERRRRALVAITIALFMTASGNAHAASLTSETVAAWGQYVRRVEARLAHETRDVDGFLAADFRGSAHAAELRARLGRGEIFIENVPGSTVDVGGGTISHWRGYVLVRGSTLEDLVEGAAMRSQRARKRPEDVLDARVLSRDGDSLRLFLKLQRQAIVNVAYNTEHLVSYQRLGSTRAASQSVSTRIAELRDAGSPSEREKPVGQDRGFMWRLHSYWRYQAVAGGVIVELESLTLSRDVPWALRAVASPVIDRIARESMTRTLASLRS